MTYNQLEKEFYFEYADRCGVICATPIELYNEIQKLSKEKGSEEVVWEELEQYLKDKDYNDFCIYDVKVCIKRVNKK